MSGQGGTGRGWRACAHRQNGPFSCAEEEELVLRSAIPCFIFGPAKPSNIQVNNASVQRITGYAVRVVVDRIVVEKVNEAHARACGEARHVGGRAGEPFLVASPP